MKKKLIGFLTSLLLLASVGLAYGDAETIGGTTINPNLLVKATDCSPFIWEGVPCWDTDDDDLYVGDGTAALLVGGGSGVADGTYGDIIVSSGAWSLGVDTVDDTMVNWGTGANQVSAADMPVDATGFSGQLSGTDTDVQTALSTLDSMVIVAGTPVDEELCNYESDDGGIYCEDGIQISGGTLTFKSGNIGVTDYVTSDATHLYLGTVPSAGLNANADRNTCVGVDACAGVNYADDSTALGYRALASAAVYNDDNVAIGSYALENIRNNGGGQTVAVGTQAGQSIGTASSDSVCIGHNSCYSTSEQTGFDYSTCVGSEACRNQHGVDVVAVGGRASWSYTIASDSRSIFIGKDAGFDLGSSGGARTDNIVIGYNAGTITHSSYDYNILIGNGVDPVGGAADSNFMSIANLIYADGLQSSSDLGTTVTNANVGIRDSSPDAQLDILIKDASTVGLNLEMAATPAASPFCVNTTGVATCDVFELDEAGYIHQTSTQTTGHVYEIDTATITSGDIFNVVTTTSAMTGDLLYADLADGSGTFTGDFLDFYKNSVQTFTVAATGDTKITLNANAQNHVLTLNDGGYSTDNGTIIQALASGNNGAFYFTDSGTTSADIVSILHNTSAKTSDVIRANMAVSTGSFTGDFLEFLVNSGERFAVGYRGDVDINSQMTGGNVFDITETTGTGGNTFSVEHSTSAKTGNVYTANMAVSSGSFAGDFANFQVNNVEKAVIDASGNMDIAGSLRFMSGGVSAIGGVNGTNNEDLGFDFESTANEVVVDSNTGVLGVVFDGIHIDATMGFTETDTDVDITIAADVNSRTYYNNHASAITYNLPADPEDGAGNGKMFCFRNLVAQAMTINPDDADYIHYNTTGAIAVGEAIVSTGAIGEYVCVLGMDDGSNDYWVTFGINGVWAEETP